MTKIFTLCAIVLLSLGLAVQDADARRLGGGGSFGKQRSGPSQNQAPAPAPAPGAPAPAGASKWLGPLAGLAAGGMLASLFMGQGAGGALGSILLIAALATGVFLLFRMLRRPVASAAHYAGGSTTGMPGMPVGGGVAMAAAIHSSRPLWFEDAPFAREAKKHFIRLQDANDRGDLNDIREFVTPEMYAEISLQIQERGDKPNKTEVVSLNADIADVVTEGDLVIASVRFTGLIREEANAPAVAFNEIWHIQKSESQAKAAWFIAGIQQA